MITTPADLAAAAEALRRSNTDACHAVADALAAVAEGRADSLDALLLDRGPGKRTVATLARIQRRDHAIRAAAAGHYQLLGTPEEQGRALHRDLTGYSLAGFRADARTGRPPASKRHLYAIRVECLSNAGIPGPERFSQIIRGPVRK